MKAARAKTWCERVFVALAIGVVVWFYTWTARSANAFGDWGDWDYYRLLVRGFREGHLYLAKAPPPELLALADPYDPAQNAPYRLPDASYFRGHYYIYFGAAPAAVLMWPVTVLTGNEMTTGAAVWVFATIGFLAAAGLWLAIRRRYFPESSVWIAPAGVLGLGAATHALALLRRPMWWELPIAAGIAFSMLALVAVYRAVHGRRPMLAMAAAGLCVGLAVASRPTCLFAAPLLLPPLWLAWRERWPGGAWWRMALAAALPLAACGVAVLGYNYARFENPLEFGQNYQLSGAYESKLQHFSLRYVWHNIGVVFFQPLRWTWEFPFVDTWEATTDIPGYFGSEQLAGLVRTFPFVGFVVAMPLVWLSRRAGAETRLKIMLAAIAGYFVPVCGLLLCFFATTPRYMADFATALALSAACGLLALERLMAGRWMRHVVVAAAVATAALSAAFAVLLSFDYHGRSPQRENPTAWNAYAAKSEAWLARVGLAARQLEGPRVLKVRFVQQPVGTTETFWESRDARAAERILMEHLGEQLIRFGFARGGGTIEWGRPLRWEKGHTHTVELQLPSLYGPTDRAMSGLRRGAEFRERSSVVVWFSGGRALALLVEPVRGRFEEGGRVPENFSGDVRRSEQRLLRADETGLEAQPDPAAAVGGVLQLRVRFPDVIAAEGEPLFAAGALHGSDIVLVREAEGAVQFVIDHFGSPRVESRPIALERNREHSVEIELPSFRPEAFGVEARGVAVVRVNGQEVIRHEQLGYYFGPGSEAIGRNSFGSGAGPEFRGWILDARWVR